MMRPQWKKRADDSHLEAISLASTVEIEASTQARLRHLCQRPHLFRVTPTFERHDGLIQPRRKTTKKPVEGWFRQMAVSGDLQPGRYSLSRSKNHAATEERDCGVNEMVYEATSRCSCFSGDCGRPPARSCCR